MKNVATIMECSRIFSLPMTIQSWLVIFVFSLIDSGNILYGILALLGICFAHLGANIFDDYIDYKSLIKQVNFLTNAAKQGLYIPFAGQIDRAYSR